MTAQLDGKDETSNQRMQKEFCQHINPDTLQAASPTALPLRKPCVARRQSALRAAGHTTHKPAQERCYSTAQTPVTRQPNACYSTPQTPVTRHPNACYSTTQMPVTRQPSACYSTPQTPVTRHPKRVRCHSIGDRCCNIGEPERRLAIPATLLTAWKTSTSCRSMSKAGLFRVKDTDLHTSRGTDCGAPFPQEQPYPWIFPGILKSSAQSRLQSALLISSPPYMLDR